MVRIETDLATGSGVIFETVGNSAHVLTNSHVIEDAAWVDIIVNDISTYQGTVLGFDALRDLAVVKICCGSFESSTFGDASGLPVGTEVVVIGYALGIVGSATVTRGIVSAVRYDGDMRRWVIQTDASINPGNSGGPLLSIAGEVLGINTFKFESTGSRPVEGLGFAVSELTIREQLPTLKAGARVALPTPIPTPFDRVYTLVVDAGTESSIDKPVSFKVGNLWAIETATWKMGGTTELNLTAFSGRSRYSNGEGGESSGDTSNGGLLGAPFAHRVPPHVFVGTVEADAVPALVGSTVSAWVDGRLVAASTVTKKRLPTTVSRTASTFESLGQILNVIWIFKIRIQAWEFYSTDERFSAVNTYTDAASGDIVWVYVHHDQMFQGQQLFAGWNIISIK